MFAKSLNFFGVAETKRYLSSDFIALITKVGYKICSTHAKIIP